MTISSNLEAARSRVGVAEHELDSARQALAIAEHQAYADALALIATEVRDALAVGTEPGIEHTEALDNINLVLEGIGVRAPAKAEAPKAVRA